MRFLKCFSVLTALIPAIGFCNTSLQFGTPTVVSGSSLEVNSTAPIISATAAGFMLCWQNPSADVIASLSTNLGVSWSPTTVGMDSLAYPSIAGNQTGFVALWTDATPGFGSGYVMSAFFDQTTQSWGSPILIDDSTTAAAPAFVASSKNGFIATWAGSDYRSVYANVSTDGVTWQSASMQIGSSIYDLSSVSGCGNSEMFLVAWHDNTTDSIYIATSTNNGGSWSGPSLAVADIIPQDFYGVGCFANEQGFLLTYGDGATNIWSVFSTNGVDWTSPTLIATNFGGSYAIFPSVSGTDAGFVVSWAGSDSNAYASLSENNGTTWSAPAAITSDGSVYAPYFSSVNVSAYNNHCMASWTQSDGTAWISLSPFPSSAPTGPRKQNGGLFFPVTPNKPGFQFNR